MLFDPKYDQFIVKDFRRWRLYLHENQCYLGRMYIAAKSNRYTDMAEMPRGPVRDEFFDVVQLARKALATTFNPDHVNYAWLANEWHHAHMHIIPRYRRPITFIGHIFEDTLWGKNYAPYNEDYALDPKIRDLITVRLKHNMELAPYP